MSDEHARRELLSADDWPAAVLVVDARGQVTDANEAAVDLLADAQALVGERLAALGPLAGWWQQIAPDGVVPERIDPNEREAVDGCGRSVGVTARVGADPDGERRLVLVLRVDPEVGMAPQDHGEMLATVAHELRSPVTNIKGLTGALRSKWDRFTDAQRRLMVETVDADADRLVRRTAELLDYARIEAGALTVRRDLVDLAALVRRQHDELLAAGLGAAGRVEVRIDADVPSVWGDPDKLERILANLIDNAVRHGSGRVLVALESIPDGLALVVDDEGEGVPSELRDLVFGKFWRGGRRSGTGLGLYIVRGLVEAHGGRVSVGDAASGGARFRVELPSGAPPEPTD